jgi:hypothetical protein
MRTICYLQICHTKNTTKSSDSQEKTLDSSTNTHETVEDMNKSNIECNMNVFYL